MSIERCYRCCRSIDTDFNLEDAVYSPTDSTVLCARCHDADDTADRDEFVNRSEIQGDKIAMYNAEY